MRDDLIEREARTVRQLVASLGRRAKTTPVPAGVRQRILTVAQRAAAAGWSQQAVAQAVGVSIGSLRHWALPLPGATAVVPVRVAPPAAAGTAPLAVVSPAGYRVEGLDVATAATLLRTLG
jgi:transposase